MRLILTKPWYPVGVSSFTQKFDEFCTLSQRFFQILLSVRGAMVMHCKTIYLSWRRLQGYCYTWRFVSQIHTFLWKIVEFEYDEQWKKIRGMRVGVKRKDITQAAAICPPAVGLESYSISSPRLNISKFVYQYMSKSFKIRNFPNSTNKRN